MPAEPHDVAVGDPLTLGVRPEHLVLGARDGGPTVNLDVYVAEPLGGETVLYGHVDERHTMVVKVQGGARVAKGQRIPVSLIPEMCHLFDRGGVAVPRPAGAGDTLDVDLEKILRARLS